MKRKLAIGAGVAVLVLAAGLAWWKFAPRRTPAGQPPLTILDSASLAAFRDEFNTRSGEVRIIAMLSPT